jgi:hypothetical protein
MVDFKVAALNLKNLIERGKAMSSDADLCRDVMDENYIKCTKAQQEELDTYVSDLHSGKDTKD